MNSTEKGKKLYIEILRIFACLLVIYNHTEEQGFFLYQVDSIGSLPYIVHLIFTITSKCAVPIFFTISGALLITKEESIKSTYHRIIKFLIDVMLFSTLYRILDFIATNRDIDFYYLLTSLV